jgi:hypothetical protein
VFCFKVLPCTFHFPAIYSGRWSNTSLSGFFFAPTEYRLIHSNGKIEKDIFGIVYVYRRIITNDWKSSEKAIVSFYNKRDESEKNFDVQNNDFRWVHLPFSFLEENTVFMLVTAC